MTPPKGVRDSLRCAIFLITAVRAKHSAGGRCDCGILVNLRALVLNFLPSRLYLCSLRIHQR